MYTAQELYDIIVAANLELQKLLSLLLSIYADEHALTNPLVAGKNSLHTLLSTHIKTLKKVIKPYVSNKLFTSKNTILPLVDAKKLDNSLLFDIFLKVEDILSIDHKIGNCTKCIGACCTDCNHFSPRCKKCKGNDCTPTKKCLHPCGGGVSCTQILQECKEHKMICCTFCAACIACNKTAFENDAISILTNPSALFSTCPRYAFINSLEMAKCFRELFGHVTIAECEDFMINGAAFKEEFKNFTKPKEFKVYLQFLFKHIVDHAKTKLQDVLTNVITNINKILSPSPEKSELNNMKEYLNYVKECLDETMDNLQCIFESPFETSLESVKEELTAVNDKEKQDDGYNNKVKLVRRINKGFVLKLPLAEEEDIKVKYKRDGDGDECWIEADVVQKREDGTVYLRVDGLPHAGDFDVRLTLTFEGVFKQEILQSVKVIELEQWITRTGDGYLTIVATPNRSDEDIFSFCTDHLDQDNHIHKTTMLAIKMVDNDGDHSIPDAESDETFGDEFDQEADYVSDEESMEHKEVLNAGQFSKKGLLYFERNFVSFEDIITFPPLNVIKDDLTREISGKFTNLLKQESKPGLKILLSNYDDAKFSQFVRVKKVRKLFDGAVPATNRLLLFYSQLATIVSARIVNDKVNIHNEMANCINDLKLFSCTFKSVVNNNVIVTGLLVCPHLSRAEVEEEMWFYFNKGDQSRMEYFFLSKDELESSKLTKWWKNVFRRRLLKIFLSIKSSTSVLIYHDMFKRISGQCMMTIALCNVENKSMLPSLSDDPQKQILSLVLSTSQLNAIHAPAKKKLVYGPYWSGKSIVAECVVRLFYEEACLLGKKSLIVYAIQDDQSLLEVKNRRFVDGFKAEINQRGIDTGGNGSCLDDLVSIESGTFYSLVGQSSDGYNSLLNFVKRILIERNAFDSINLVIDEMDHNSIEGENEIEELKKLLKLVDRFVIFPRSAYLRLSSSWEGELQQKSNLHQLGLEPYSLEGVMRNSVEIVNLAESSQKTVETSKTILQYPFTPFQIIDAPKHPKALDWSKTSISYSRRRSHEEEVTTGSLDQENSLAHQEEMRGTMQVNNADISSTEHGKKKIKVSVNLLNAAKHIDKQMHSSSKMLELGSTFIECIPGHKVTTRKPNLINLPKTFDLHSDNGAKILSVVLDKICLKNFNPLLKSPIFDSPTIVCNEIEEVNITYYALALIPRLQDCCIVYAPDLRRKYISLEEKKTIYNAVKSGNKILITDNCSMRGMESVHVITFINPLAKIDRFALPEVLTRAIVSLDIISFPVDETAMTEEAGTLGDVVNSWLGQNKETKQKLVEVTDLTASLDSINQDEICSKEQDRLIIHVQSRKFNEYGYGHPTFKQFLDLKQEELSTEELSKTDVESAVSIHAAKFFLSLTEDVKHSSTNVASTSTSTAAESTVVEQTGDGFFYENV